MSRIELGGVDDERDKVFWASGGTIRAITKKGKEYLKLTTNVTEVRLTLTLTLTLTLLLTLQADHTRHGGAHLTLT